MADKLKDNKKMGRGLGEILKQEGTLQQKLEFIQKDVSRNKIYIAIDRLVPNPFQTPKVYNPQQISELALSIQERGIVLPILVRPHLNYYQIISGEKRWWAAIEAKLTEVPVISEDLDDKTMKEISLIEQLQRDDITPLEEAFSYKNLIEQYGYSHQNIAKQIGRSRVYVTNLVRITSLPTQVLDLIRQHKISMSHVRPLVGKDEATILNCVQQIMQRKLSVRESERLICESHEKPLIKVTNKQVIIDYNSQEELQKILKKLN